jgi:hypothetical protein
MTRVVTWVSDNRRILGFMALYGIYSLEAGSVLMWELREIALPSIIGLLGRLS